VGMNNDLSSLYMYFHISHPTTESVKDLQKLAIFGAKNCAPFIFLVGLKPDLYAICYTLT